MAALLAHFRAGAPPHLMAAEEDRLWHQASTADQDGTASRAGFLRLKKVAPRLLTFG